MAAAIIVERLGKRFSQYHPDRPKTIMEAALSGWKQLKPVQHFWALRHVSFTVAPGEMFGIIGRNGAGKSTLLQLLGGVGRPDEGSVKLKGRVGALLDLGAGLHSDLTGRENAFVCGVVAGLTRKEVARCFDDIIEFAELAQFIDNPVRTYSTGMQMRLAFSVAVHTQPQILLVDEFLSVGDFSFQAKCVDRIMELKAQGCAIVYISHDVGQVEQLCDQVLWLREGQVAALGKSEIVAGQYVAEMRSETKRRTPNRPPQLTRSGIELRLDENRFGSLEAEIIDVRLTPAEELDCGDALLVEIEYVAHQPIDTPIFSISISCEDGKVCLDMNTESIGTPLPRIEGKGLIALQIDRLDLSNGQYFVDVGLYEQNWKYAYDYHWHTYPFKVRSSIPTPGMLHPPCHWHVQPIPQLK